MTMKRSLISAALVMFSSSVAIAGDFSTLNVLGFSEDGSIFAFEEYGIQDGSGFPYANRFYIDTATDSFVSGSPIRKRIDDEAANVADARDMAAQSGSAIIADNDLVDGFTAGLNSVTELSADPYRMAVNPRPVVPPIDAEIEFRLKELQFVASGSCAGVTESSVGFSLTQIATEPGQTARILHKDESVPSSRACPTGYRIGGVHTYYPQSGTPVFAITIAVKSFGFEGPDYRWMAVTTRAQADN
jgi:predicted secreted protein